MDTADGSTKESVVKSIDGNYPYTYFLDMANREISNNWPTIGARMNMLLTFSKYISSSSIFLFFTSMIIN